MGHPLDTIKVRIQTMELVPGQPPPYTGLVDCASKIVKKEGVSGARGCVHVCLCAGMGGGFSCAIPFTRCSFRVTMPAGMH